MKQRNNVKGGTGVMPNTFGEENTPVKRIQLAKGTKLAARDRAPRNSWAHSLLREVMREVQYDPKEDGAVQLFRQKVKSIS